MLGALRAWRDGAQPPARKTMSTPRPAVAGEALARPPGPGDATADRPAAFCSTDVPTAARSSDSDDGRIVNVVGLEQYLYSVVPREMSASWPPAALTSAGGLRAHVRPCAQRSATSVRSRAVGVEPSLRRDRGRIAGRNAAVDATAGTVLTFVKRFALVAYSSCCGGHTEASSEAWGGRRCPISPASLHVVRRIAELSLERRRPA